MKGAVYHGRAGGSPPGSPPACDRQCRGPAPVSRPISRARRVYCRVEPRRLGGRSLSEPLFDLAAEYDEMLDRGIRLSGESREFFLRGRVAALLAQLPAGFR